MLGLGAMRLPLCSKDDADIDIVKTKEMVAYAMEHGINYYDTAWGYHNGQSEIVIGEILNEYPRESYYLASKFPGYDISNMDKAEEIFEKQLQKAHPHQTEEGPFSYHESNPKSLLKSIR